MGLRSYQVEALDIARKRFRAGIRRQLLSMPTGVGKTVVFAALPETFGFQNRTLVLVHREELAEQAASKLRKWNPTYTVGVEMGTRHCRPNDRIVVAGVDTLGRKGSKRLLRLDPSDFDGVICDEAHHSVAPKYKRVFEHFGFTGHDPEKFLFGVTATPNRSDKQGLGQVYDEIVYDYPMLRAIREGWLSDLIGIRVKTKVILDAVRSRYADFEEGPLSKTVDTEARNELIVRSWLERANDRQTIAFTVDIAHAVHLAEAFKRHGIAAEAIWGDDPHRADKLRAHREDHLTVLCNCSVLTEGYDDWRVGCVIAARPTQSSLLFTQQAGRGTRIPDFPGGISLVEARERGLAIEKDDCILLDVVDNTSKHSLVTLASLFGLPANADLNGKSVSNAVDLLEAAMQKRPQADFSKLDSLNNLQSFMEKADLYRIKSPHEVLDNSKLQWHPTPAGSYVLLLPTNERVHVFRDLLDRWHISGSVHENKLEDVEPTFEGAITRAETLLKTFGHNMTTSLLGEKRRHEEPATQAQINTIKRFTKEWKQQLDFDGMTKAEASRVLGKLFTHAHNKRVQDDKRGTP